MFESKYNNFPQEKASGRVAYKMMAIWGQSLLCNNGLACDPPGQCFQKCSYSFLKDFMYFDVW